MSPATIACNLFKAPNTCRYAHASHNCGGLPGAIPPPASCPPPESGAPAPHRTRRIDTSPPCPRPHARRAQRLHQIRIALLEHETSVDRRRKCPDPLDRQRIGHPQLQHARLRRRVPCMQITHSRRDDPQRLPRPMLAVQRPVSFHAAISASFCRNRRCASRAYAGIITRPRTSRTNSGFGGAASAGRPHHALAMANPRGHPEQHRNPPPLRNLDGLTRKKS
jgi:hypothetical protein